MTQKTEHLVEKYSAHYFPGGIKTLHELEGDALSDQPTELEKEVLTLILIHI